MDYRAFPTGPSPHAPSHGLSHVFDGEQLWLRRGTRPPSKQSRQARQVRRADRPVTGWACCSSASLLHCAINVRALPVLGWHSMAAWLHHCWSSHGTARPTSVCLMAGSRRIRLRTRLETTTIQQNISGSALGHQCSAGRPPPPRATTFSGRPIMAGSRLTSHLRLLGYILRQCGLDNGTFNVWAFMPGNCNKW